jgi:type I restriction enzyme, S subunit
MMESTGALRYFTTIKNGSTPASGEPAYWDGDTAWATPDDLGRLNSNRISETKRTITPLAVAENHLNVVPAETVLMSTRAPIGHMAIAAVPMAFNQGCRALIPNERTFGPYLLYLLKSRVPELNASANGTTFVELSRDDLASVRIALPSLETQKRIATFLDAKTARIDELIAKKEALLDQLAENRRAIITQAVTKGLNPAAPMKDSGIDWLGQIPAHWSVIRLRFLLNEDTRNGLYKTKDEFSDGGVPFVQMGEAFRDIRFRGGTKDRVLTDAKEIARWSLQAGDFLIARRSIVFEGSGKSVLIEQLDEPHLFESSMIRIRLSNRVLPKFLSNYFQSAVCRAFFLAITKQVTISGIDSQQLKDIPVPVPPDPEAREAAEYIDHASARLAELEAQVQLSLTRLTGYRASLITAAVTGQIERLR